MENINQLKWKLTLYYSKSNIIDMYIKQLMLNEIRKSKIEELQRRLKNDRYKSKRERNRNT